MTEAIALLPSHRPVTPGTYKVTAMCFLQNPQNKTVEFYFLNAKLFWYQLKKYWRKRKVLNVRGEKKINVPEARNLKFLCLIGY